MSEQNKKVETVEDMLIEACKYGYDYHASTQFPEMSFEDNCKNNFLQKISNWKQSDPTFIAQVVETILRVAFWYDDAQIQEPNTQERINEIVNQIINSSKK